MRIPTIRVFITRRFTGESAAEEHQEKVNDELNRIAQDIRKETRLPDLSSIEVYIENKVEDGEFTTIVTFMLPFSQYDTLSPIIAR